MGKPKILSCNIISVVCALLLTIGSVVVIVWVTTFVVIIATIFCRHYWCDWYGIWSYCCWWFSTRIKTSSKPQIVHHCWQVFFVRFRLRYRGLLFWIEIRYQNCRHWNATQRKILQWGFLPRLSPLGNLVWCCCVAWCWWFLINYSLMWALPHILGFIIPNIVYKIRNLFPYSNHLRMCGHKNVLLYTFLIIHVIFLYHNYLFLVLKETPLMCKLMKKFILLVRRIVKFICIDNYINKRG